jgi:hypothetical protein
MSSDGDDDFLNRWSRRKHAARRGAALPEPDPPPPAAEAPPAPAASMPAAETPAPELPPVESLKGLESEYQDFLRPDVDPATRSAALRKLFGDPHFNQMDGLDIYIDDYTKADPIPPAMLRTLNQARTLGLFEKEEREEEERKKAEGSTTEPTPATTPTETAALEQPTEPPSVEPTAPSPAEQTTKTPEA